MKKINALLYIDANLYLPLYQITEGKKLADQLKEQKDYIFVTVQIIEEVQRNKLQQTASYLTNQFEQLKKSHSFNLPDYIFEGTDAKLRETLRSPRKKEIKTDLTKAAIQALQRISQSEDQVSKALDVVFSKAVPHTPEELQRARDRKERGNPPGKTESTLGDQLTWEQLLSHCKGKSKVWIISIDSDYCTKHAGKMFLNPLLYRDLVQVMEPVPEVFCFERVNEGIDHFVKRTGVQATIKLTPEESKEIKKELDSLPPCGWTDTSMDDTNRVAILTRHRQRMLSPALWAALYSQGDEGWNPGMQPDPGTDPNPD